MTTPADRYAAFRDRKADPELAGFRALYDFDFDPFQVEACRALGAGRGVLVAAPTGSGKTVIGEYAVHLALAEGRKCFYTTPIKALSNQKYADLVARYGPERVGLLTGDNSVNGEADIVVMTTEVLRNMLYARSHTLAGLAYVVMDEVHYLPARPEVVERLDRAGLLPAIVFIFSRVGCDAAVVQCLRAGLRLTSQAERAEILAHVEERTADLPDEDLDVLGYHEWLDGLT